MIKKCLFFICLLVLFLPLVFSFTFNFFPSALGSLRWFTYKNDWNVSDLEISIRKRTKCNSLVKKYNRLRERPTREVYYEMYEVLNNTQLNSCFLNTKSCSKNIDSLYFVVEEIKSRLGYELSYKEKHPQAYMYHSGDNPYIDSSVKNLIKKQKLPERKGHNLFEIDFSLRRELIKTCRLNLTNFFISTTEFELDYLETLFITLPIEGSRYVLKKLIK